jgi:hypothetical protein
MKPLSAVGSKINRLQKLKRLLKRGRFLFMIASFLFAIIFLIQAWGPCAAILLSVPPGPTSNSCT